MSKTKVIGYLIILMSVLNTAIDFLNGGDFSVGTHWNEIYAALVGAGFIKIRTAIQKLEQ